MVWHPKLYSEVIEHFKTYWSKERITALRKMKKKTTNNKVQHPVHQHDAWMSRSGEHQTTFGAPNCIEREADFDKQTVTEELEELSRCVLRKIHRVPNQALHSNVGKKKPRSWRGCPCNSTAHRQTLGSQYGAF